MSQPAESSFSAPGPPPSEVAGRVEAIIDAAERAASEIRAAAHAEADRRLEEAERTADRMTRQRIGQLSELTDSLIERSELLRRQCDELSRALEGAIHELAATPAPEKAQDVPSPRT
jgi:hypothetical protein